MTKIPREEIIKILDKWLKDADSGKFILTAREILDWLDVVGYRAEYDHFLTEYPENDPNAKANSN